MNYELDPSSAATIIQRKYISLIVVASVVGEGTRRSKKSCPILKIIRSLFDKIWKITENYQCECRCVSSCQISGEIFCHKIRKDMASYPNELTDE